MSSSSIISKMLSSLFGHVEIRVLILGLDAAGKTTILYKLKLGEIVTTIPTIGFNVETIDYRNTSVTCWDVGGCDKIRPLWRHYYQNTQGIIFVVDSNDHERLDGEGYDVYSTAKGLLTNTLREDELRDAVVLLFCNKQDLPNALSPEVIAERLTVSHFQHQFKIHIQPCNAVTGEGLYEGLDWLISTLKDPQHHLSSHTASTREDTKPPTTPTLSPQEELLQEWLTREDTSDDVFLQQLSDYTLDSWDHYTHLRLAWVVLQRFGYHEGLPMIFSLIKNFIEHSPRTRSGGGGVVMEAGIPKRGTTFHETMTYFWVGMVHYAMVATKLPPQQHNFKTFLLLNPQLCNGGLFLVYYSKELMLMNPIARKQVLLPDLQPLPSVVPKQPGSSPSPISDAGKERLEIAMPSVLEMSDHMFYQMAMLSQLPSWGHVLKLRLIYVLLCLYGRRRGGVDHILQVLHHVEKDGFHMTLSYFWIQMMTLVMMKMWKEEKLPDTSFGALTSVEINDQAATLPWPEYAVYALQHSSVRFVDVVNKPVMQDKLNMMLYLEYYSKECVDGVLAASSFVLPDKKQLPSQL